MRVRVEIDIDFARDVKRRSCSFCGRRVTVKNGFLELYSTVAGRLTLPGFGEPLCVLTHAGCGPDAGYALRLDRLLEEDVEIKHGLVDHLERKAWVDDVYIDGVRAAAKMLKQVRK